MCSATGRIWPLCFMPLYIVYDSFSLAMVLNAILLHWFSTRNIRITAPSRKCGNDYFVFPELSLPTPGCLVQVSFEYLQGWRSHSLPAHLFQFFITLMRIFFPDVKVKISCSRLCPLPFILLMYTFPKGLALSSLNFL